MFKPTYLYIKTHNKTGLKYFGKTTSKDPYKYQGSGTRWKNHIKKHGYDVTTEIVGYFIDEEECKQKAIEFGKENDIVESSVWANLKEEKLEGGFDYINSNKLNVKNLEKAELSRKENKSWITGLNSMNLYWDINGRHSLLESAKTYDSIEKRKKTFAKIKHQQGEKHSQYGTIWIFNPLLKQNKKIKRNEDIPDGWERGRKIKWN